MTELDLQRSTRETARRVLGGIPALVRDLPTPEARFAATRPAYRQLVEAGVLRRLIPARPAGRARGWRSRRCWPRSSTPRTRACR